jgi:hypothetical protein
MSLFLGFVQALVSSRNHSLIERGDVAVCIVKPPAGESPGPAAVLLEVLGALDMASVAS